MNKIDKRWLKISKEKLYQEYIVKKQSLIAVAKIFKTDRYVIKRHLKKHNIPIRHYSPTIDISNKRFGKLIAIKNTFKVKKNRTSCLWQCKCDCGNLHLAEAGLLQAGNIKSCGKCKYFHGIPLSIWNNQKHYKRHKWLVTDEYLWDLFEKQNKKCALSGIDIGFPIDPKDKKGRTASLDRIDSSKEYEVGNVQWVHRDINIMKNRFSQQYFIQICKNIAENNK